MPQDHDSYSLALVVAQYQSRTGWCVCTVKASREPWEGLKQNVLRSPVIIMQKNEMQGRDQSNDVQVATIVLGVYTRMVQFDVSKVIML